MFLSMSRHNLKYAFVTIDNRSYANCSSKIVMSLNMKIFKINVEFSSSYVDETTSIIKIKITTKSIVEINDVIDKTKSIFV
jgi:hypothetical protein